MTNLASAFAASVDRCPDKTAIFWGDDVFTYRQLMTEASQLAAQLVAEGVKPGDHVGLWLKNCPQFIPALFGILLAGGVAVPINNFLKPAEVSYILKDSGIRVLISSSDAHEGILALQTLQPGLRVVDALAVHPVLDAVSLPPPCPASDLAIIIYTSGTTGHPKGAMLSHANLLHNVNSCRQVLEAVDFDRFVLLLPMFHSFMLCVCICLPLIVGGSIVLIRSVHPPKAIFHEIIKHQATILPAIPQLFRALAANPLPANLPLRLCISGAAPLPAQILNEFQERVGIPLIEGYGLSEASPVVSLNPIRGARKGGSIGQPIPDVEVTIQDESGNELPVKAVGEICVRGGNVMRGYWNQPEETAKALHNGWLLTGDVGYRDEDGYFFITDRKKDMLLVNGINVYPREIEELLYLLPGVREAAVVGTPDPRRGEQAIAFVSMTEGTPFDAKAILHQLREQLADYKVPRHIYQLNALPRNATGKVLKTDLRKLYQAELVHTTVGTESQKQA